jgi:hypothetical protein
VLLAKKETVITGHYTEVLHRVKEDGNILHTIQGRKANCNGHILDRNCLPKRVPEGTIGEGYM